MPLNKPDFALKLGDNADRGYYVHNERFNHLMCMVPTEDTDHSLANLNACAILVPMSGSVKKVFRVSEDYNFQILGVNFSVYFLNIAGIYRFFDSYVTNRTLALETDDIQVLKGLPFERYIKISMSISFPTGKYLYGGQSFSTNHEGQMAPISILTMAGQDGWGQLRTPYMVPKDGTIMVEFNNTNTVKDLYVAGYIYGEKVKV